ncbi:MAG: hypothetical protein AABZ74_01470 [Cyanobacteriota bacterium]
MNKLTKKIFLLFLISSFFITSCATTTVITHKIGEISYEQNKKSSALILWGTAWRKDQKEVKLREEIAEKAISNFFSKTKVFSSFKILKNVDKKSAIELSDIEALNINKESEIKYDKIIFIRVEELGPLFFINLSAILFEGYTEVKLRVRSLNTNNSALEYDTYSEWKNGNPFIIKGVKTLEEDMTENLKTIFTN